MKGLPDSQGLAANVVKRRDDVLDARRNGVFRVPWRGLRVRRIAIRQNRHMPRFVKDEIEIAMAGPFVDILRDVAGTDCVGSERGVKPVLDVIQDRSETL